MVFQGTFNSLSVVLVSWLGDGEHFFAILLAEGRQLNHRQAAPVGEVQVTRNPHMARNLWKALQENHQHDPTAPRRSNDQRVTYGVSDSKGKGLILYLLSPTCSMTLEGHFPNWGKVAQHTSPTRNGNIV
jgi:hypothetical protein